MNRNQLKTLAAFAMLLDHIAAAFLPAHCALYQILKMIGRLAGPLMAFFIAEGYVHTRDIRRYTLRLGVFALLSWPAFSLFEYGSWPSASFGAIYTLLLGLTAIRIWDRSGWNPPAKSAAVFILCGLSCFGDWAVFGVLLPLLFFLFRENEKETRRAYLAAAVSMAGISLLVQGQTQLFQIGLLAVPLLLHLYHGENGRQSPFSKWFFYVFYPGHLLLLWWLKLLLTGFSG